MKAPPSGDKHAPYSIAGVVAAIAAIMIAATGLGHSLPLFSILLKNYGVSDSLIGLNTAMYALGFTALAPFFPRIIIALGLKPFIFICVTLMVVSYGAIYLAGDTIWLWYPIRAVYGFAVAGIFVGSEIWVNKLAPPHIRGQIIGIYTTFVALGLALGPLLVDLYGYDGLLPFAIGMGIFALAALPICFVKAPKPSPQHSAKGFFKFIPKAPATFLSAAIFAAVESAILVFLPILAIEKGWGAEIGARSISVYGFGMLAMQYLIGRFADRTGHNRTLTFCAVGCLVMSIIFCTLNDTPFTLFPILFLWGGLLAGLYTVGLTIVGARFDENDITATNTGLVFTFGVGAVLGPLSAGLVRQWTGPDGLSLFLILLLGLYAVMVWQRRHKTLP